MEAACSTATVANVYQTTQHYVLTLAVSTAQCVDTPSVMFTPHYNTTSEKPPVEDHYFSTKLVLNPQTEFDDTVGQSQLCFGLWGHNQMILQ